jgi:2'-5' RNA ligase
MGRFFTSFDEAWQEFLVRTDPLEPFFDAFPDDEHAVIEGWVVEPPQAVKDEARRVQERLARFEWLAPVPDHFLHVWLAEEVAPGATVRAEAGPVTCFHDAVVAEVHGGLARLVPDAPQTFLPHLSLAYVREAHDPAELREALRPLRGEQLGAFEIDEVQRVRVPAARTTVTRPWQVVRTLALG